MNYIYENINKISKNTYKQMLILINEDKKQKINKITNAVSKKRSILGEFLLIKLLQSANINYNNLKFYKNRFGKPYINNCNLFYNISHSNNYAVCVISNVEIGIDIEKIRKVDLKIVDQFATSNEIQYITQNKEEIYKRFFEIYTLKESYFKCLGTDLSNIKEVEFTMSNNNIVCSDSQIIATIFYDIKGYIISICKSKN